MNEDHSPAAEGASAKLLIAKAGVGQRSACLECVAERIPDRRNPDTISTHKGAAEKVCKARSCEMSNKRSFP